MGDEGGYAYRVPVGEARLAELDTGRRDGVGRKEAEKELEALTDELGELQEELFGAAQNAVPVVRQGTDTSGKDGTIKGVFREVTPVGRRVLSFKAPTEEELAHHFLWRIYRALPARGFFGVFNRSHYEDVIVPHVRADDPTEAWRERYQEIREFERNLTRAGTIVVKFFLHISREEQKERLLARERWDRYAAAYEEAIGRCNSAECPWFVVPANQKWYRNLAVARALARPPSCSSTCRRGAPRPWQRAQETAPASTGTGATWSTPGVAWSSCWRSPRSTCTSRPA